MAKRKLSRTDTRSSGGSAGRSSSSRSKSSPTGKRSTGPREERSERPRKFSDKPSGERRSPRSADSRNERPTRKFSDKPSGERRGRSTDSNSERSTRKFSDKPFDKRKSSSRFGKEDNSERPRRNFSRGDSGERSDKPFERKRPFQRDGGDKKFSRGFNTDSKPRRGFPDGFKREDEDRPSRNDGERSFGSKRPFEKREERGDRPFNKRPFEKRDENQSDRPFNKRPFEKRDDNRGERSFGKRPFERGNRSGDERHSYNKFDHGDELHRPRRDEDEESSPRRERGDKRERKSFTESRVISSKGYKGKKQEEEAPSQIRLNRYLANSGVSSRREADEYIKMGLVTVNGKTITEMGFQVQPGDVVKYEGKMLRAEKPVYILMNKPKGFLTTTSDPEERQTVMQMVAGHIKERIYPVGRLDRNTTGLLLLTNDGALAEQLMHPSYNVKKIYKVELDRPLSRVDFEKIGQGIQLEEGRAMVDDIAIVSEDGKTVGVEIHIGWNRVVRRIFESLEYQVVKLDRTIYAGLDKKDLPRGNWRHLKEEEIIRLKHLKKGTKGKE